MSTSQPLVQRRRIQQRLDALAIDQLREEASRLAVENDRLSKLLQDAEQNAEFWWDQATQLAEDLADAGVPVALTKEGEFFVGTVVAGDLMAEGGAS